MAEPATTTDSIEARIAGGQYAAKQLHSKSRVVVWSHGSRFRLARSLVTPDAGKRLLDYGCGDGTFLAHVVDLFPNAVGADICPKQTADCAARLGDIANLRFQLINDLHGPDVDGKFDLITCMETMEHCVDANLDVAFADIKRLFGPAGAFIISVPIEIGPTLLLKQIIRRVAGWRSIGHYQYSERYTWGELLKMIFAGPDTSVDRGAYPIPYPNLASPYGVRHKGFNWKSLRRRIGQSLVIQQTLFSPLNWSRGLLSSQAWFICAAMRE